MKERVQENLYWMRLYFSTLVRIMWRFILARLYYGVQYNPFVTYTVNPQRIQYIRKYDRESFGAIYLGEIRSGDWDDQKHYEPFDNLLLVRAVRDMISHEIPFLESEHCAWQLRDIEQSRKDPNRISRPMRNKEDFLKREQIIKSLYADMQAHGYRTQRELSHGNIWKKRYRLLCHEVAVAIGRDGQVFFADGQHRFLIARLLNIPIQVRVSVVHAQLVHDMKIFHKSSLLNLNEVIQGILQERVI